MHLINTLASRIPNLQKVRHHLSVWRFTVTYFIQMLVWRMLPDSWSPPWGDEGESGSTGGKLSPLRPVPTSYLIAARSMPPGRRTHLYRYR